MAPYAQVDQILLFNERGLFQKITYKMEYHTVSVLKKQA